MIQSESSTQAKMSVDCLTIVQVFVVSESTLIIAILLHMILPP